MKAFEIVETNLVNGNTRTIKELKRNCRGSFAVTKVFNSERAAKNWIAKRMKELDETDRANIQMYNPVYEVKETYC